jgi:hypothetical protein
MEKAKGGGDAYHPPERATGGPRTLADLGITRDQSSQWQKLAEVSPGDFEIALAGPDKPTVNVRSLHRDSAFLAEEF